MEVGKYVIDCSRFPLPTYGKLSGAPKFARAGTKAQQAIMYIWLLLIQIRPNANSGTKKRESSLGYKSSHYSTL